MIHEISTLIPSPFECPRLLDYELSMKKTTYPLSNIYVTVRKKLLLFGQSFVFISYCVLRFLCLSVKIFSFQF